MILLLFMHSSTGSRRRILKRSGLVSYLVFLGTRSLLLQVAWSLLGTGAFGSVCKSLFDIKIENNSVVIFSFIEFRCFEMLFLKLI